MTSALRVRCSRHLSYRGISAGCSSLLNYRRVSGPDSKQASPCWLGYQVSNLEPRGPEPRALPLIELYPIELDGHLSLHAPAWYLSPTETEAVGLPGGQPLGRRSLV